MPDPPAPQPSTRRLLGVIGAVLFLVLYDEQVLAAAIGDDGADETLTQALVLVIDVGLAALLTFGRWRTFWPFLAAIAVLDLLAFVHALDRPGIDLALSLLWIPLLYAMTRRLLGFHDGDARLLLPIFAGATCVYVVSALWGSVIDDVQTSFFAQSSALIPVLVLGLIVERGLRLDALHPAEQRALIAYTLGVVVVGEVASLVAQIPDHATLAGTWGQYTLLALTANGVGVALATIVLIGAGAHPEWERERTVERPRA